MRLGISYSCWDSEELLEYSIRSIRSNADYVSVVWQEYSNHGEICSPDLYPLLLSLQEQGLIDELSEFVPDGHSNGEGPSLNETRKRQQGLELSRAAGCTHHMTIDCDEFYTEEQLRFMMSVIEQGNFSTGYCQHRQYYKDSIYQLRVPEGEYVATIEKIYPETAYVYQAVAAVAIDPTRKTNNTSLGHPYRIFTREECEMHHMSFVRKDIHKKLNNHSSRRFFTPELIGKVALYYKNWQYPQQCMWAGGNLLDVIEVSCQFPIYDMKDRPITKTEKLLKLGNNRLYKIMLQNPNNTCILIDIGEGESLEDGIKLVMESNPDYTIPITEHCEDYTEYYLNREERTWLKEIDESNI